MVKWNVVPLLTVRLQLLPEETQISKRDITLEREFQ